MKLCILDAWHLDDPALVNSHWVAARTAEALPRKFSGVEVQVVTGDDMDSVRVAAELQRDHEGFAYFGHGRERALCRHGVILVGPEDVAAIRTRWFHAFACLSGESLCHDAAHAGAAAYLGYTKFVNMHWEVSCLPAVLCELLEDLVTVATLQLAHGERSRRGIRARVKEASDRLADWLDTNQEACTAMRWDHLAGLKVLATALYRDLAFEGIAVLD